jgi:glycosyltransferase involved in cell wall biosynthesis
LKETLLSLGRSLIQVSNPIEIVVVDNGSTDDTQSLLRTLDLAGVSLRVVFEPIAGVARARNAGIRGALGDPVIFVDDDMRFPDDWLKPLMAQFNLGYDAVAGSIRVAPHIVRPWMTPKHLEMLGSTELNELAVETSLHGGVMGFRRHVFSKVPEFDCELGVGALGSNEELLFANQLHKAGFSIGSAIGKPLEHHCNIDLLKHDNLIKRAYNMGRSSAYIAHHWEHLEPHPSPLQVARSWIGYLRRRIWSRSKTGMGIEAYEIDYHYGRGYRQQMSLEVKRPRNYEKFGLIKS